MQPISYARHQFPAEIIQHATWLYLRFTLSYRDVEELLAERGVETSYESIRRWVLKFGSAFACNLRRLRPRPTGRWHLDEMVVSIQGRRMYLWRAVDSEGEVLDLLVQPKRDTAAALRLMRKLLRKQGYAPDVLVTDKLGSYGAARRNLGLTAHHEQGLRKNNRAENSISWYDGESGKCSASNRPAQLSAFSADSRRFTTRSTFNAILSPAACFGPSWPRRCMTGNLRLLRRERELPQAILRLRPDPVTVPVRPRSSAKR